MGGSRWRRVDFHLHTPAVSSFAGLDGMNLGDPAGQRRFAEQYADRLREAGIEIAAITDYNGIRQPWFDLIRAAAAGHGIPVLPGVELSMNVGRHGVHILVVFADGTDPQEINECLRALDRQPGRPLWDGRTHHDLDLAVPPAEALRRLRERFGCLLFAAHADDRKGMVEAMGAKPAGELIAEMHLDGVDHPGGALSKLRSSGVRWRWDQFAAVEFSDPRRLADVGGKVLGDGTVRGTWLKLSATDLDAMRLALHDPQTRVRTSTPAAPGNGRILSVRVDGRGFLGGVELTFDAHLNTLIGGRGTGKSAVLETIRYALDIAPYCDQRRRQELVDHALGAGGSIRLRVQRCTEPGVTRRYEVVRVLGEPPRVLDLDTGAPVGIAAQDTFGPNRAPIVLLQREIDVISKDGAFRRELLDRLIGDDVRRAEAHVSEVRRRLSLNSTELRRHRLEQVRLGDIEHQIGVLQHELRVYEDNGVLDKLATHRRLSSIDSRLGDVLSATEAPQDWSTSLAGATTRIAELRERLTATDDELTCEAADILAETTATIAHALDQVVKAGKDAHDRVARLRRTHDSRVQELAATLNEVKQQLHADHIDADATLRYSTELDALEKERDRLIGKQPAIDALRQARRGILDELVKAHEQQTRVRQDAAEVINSRLSQRLEVIVEAFGDREQFATDLRNLLTGSGAQTSAITTIAAGGNVDGALIASTVEAGADAIVTQFGVSRAQADKIYSWLTDAGADRLAELESLAPRDRITVRLRVEEDSRDLDHLSTGQRATAILLLIFTVDGRAMLLDQPEDDLDNRFIFEDVVALIRQQKALTADGHERQIIAATHNPNIPMLGDAELVAALDATSTGMTVASQGSIDAAEIRTHIRQVLEGGEEAFMRRYHKYGGMRLDLPTPS